MKKALVVLPLLLCLSSFAFAGADDVTVDRPTNIYNTQVEVSSSPLPAVRLGVNASKAVVVINTPGSAPVVLKNTSGALSTTSNVSVSTSATSTQGITLGGAAEALPASGFPKNTLLVLTTDNALYISTEAVAGTWSWVKVGSQ